MSDDGDGTDGDDLERDVALRTLHGSRGVTLALSTLCSETDSTFDDTPALDDADDAGHGDTTDADAAGISLEDLFRSHGAHGSVMVGSHMFSTWSWKNKDMPGTMSHHTANEPRQM
jgi:hypothetical protein